VVRKRTSLVNTTLSIAFLAGESRTEVIGCATELEHLNHKKEDKGSSKQEAL
jgi:hypothetical protein